MFTVTQVIKLSKEKIMKYWKTILVMAVIMLLVAALIVITKTKLVSQEERVTLDRIRQYKIVKEEQQLIVDILQAKYDAAVLQSKMQPAQRPRPVQRPAIPEGTPVTIEGEFIPVEKLPPEMQ